MHKGKSKRRVARANLARIFEKKSVKAQIRQQYDKQRYDGHATTTSTDSSDSEGLPPVL